MSVNLGCPNPTTHRYRSRGYWRETEPASERARVVWLQSLFQRMFFLLGRNWQPRSSFDKKDGEGYWTWEKGTFRHVRQGSAPHLGRDEKKLARWAGLPHLLPDDLSLPSKRRGCLPVKEARRQRGSTNEGAWFQAFANLMFETPNVGLHAPILE